MFPKGLARRTGGVRDPQWAVSQYTVNHGVQLSTVVGFGPRPVTVGNDFL